MIRIDFNAIMHLPLVYFRELLCNIRNNVASVIHESQSKTCSHFLERQVFAVFTLSKHVQPSDTCKPKEFVEFQSRVTNANALIKNWLLMDS